MYRIRLIGGLAQKRFSYEGKTVVHKDGDLVADDFAKMYPTFCVGPVNTNPKVNPPKEDEEDLNSHTHVTNEGPTAPPADAVVEPKDVIDEAKVDEAVTPELLVEAPIADAVVETVDDDSPSDLDIIVEVDESAETIEIEVESADAPSIPEQINACESKEALAELVSALGIEVTLKGNQGLPKQKEAVLDAL